MSESIVRDAKQVADKPRIMQTKGQGKARGAIIVQDNILEPNLEYKSGGRGLFLE
jgi:hypothetical protein